MIKLVHSDVEFHEADHTYTLHGKQLSGITKIIGEMLFPDMYSAVPKSVLERAAEYGKGVHQLIQLTDEFNGQSDEPVYQTYRRLMTEQGLTRLANEYLVSDNTDIATCIDLVCEDFTLVDFKTVSRMDDEAIQRVTWQLSINAYLFELQNPTLEVNELFVMWLPKTGGGKMIRLVRIPSEVCRELVRCYIEHEPFVLPQGLVRSNSDVVFRQMPIEIITSVYEAYDRAKSEKDELNKALLKVFKENGIKSCDNEFVKVTYTEPTTRTSVDTALLKEKYPDIYEECLKSSMVKEGIKITIRK